MGEFEEAIAKARQELAAARSLLDARQHELFNLQRREEWALRQCADAQVSLDVATHRNRELNALLAQAQLDCLERKRACDEAAAAESYS